MVNRWLQELDEDLEIFGQAAVFFDLDSTLFCVSPRIEAILRDLAYDKELLQIEKEATKKLESLKVQERDWGIRPVIEREGLKASPAFFRLLKRKWSARFFSSDYLKFDRPYEGAPELVQYVAKKNVSISYLTGRDRQNMEQGTIESLKRWKFPLVDEKNLIMKPNSQRHDEDFKPEILKTHLTDSRPIWFFENEPVIIHRVRALLPSVKIIFVDSTHSGRAEPPLDLPRIGMNYRFKS